MECHTWVNYRLKHSRERLLAFAKEESDYQQEHKNKYKDAWEDSDKLSKGDREAEDKLILSYFERVHPHTGYGYNISERTGLLYTEHYFDMFRVYGYPEIECHSIRETLDFLAETQRAGKTITEDEQSMPLLEKFWKEHPDGMIVFH